VDKAGSNDEGTSTIDGIEQVVRSSFSSSLTVRVKGTAQNLVRIAR